MSKNLIKEISFDSILFGVFVFFGFFLDLPFLIITKSKMTPLCLILLFGFSFAAVSTYRGILRQA